MFNNIALRKVYLLNKIICHEIIPKDNAIFTKMNRLFLFQIITFYFVLCIHNIGILAFSYAYI